MLIHNKKHYSKTNQQFLHEKILLIFPPQAHEAIRVVFESQTDSALKDGIIELRDKYFKKNHPNWQKITRLIKLCLQ